MNDDEKGKRFLELIDEQNNLQWSIVTKLSSLINSKWNSIELLEICCIFSSYVSWNDENISDLKLDW